MQTPRTPAARDADDTLRMWHDLGMLYARAGEDARRASMRGFAAVCVAAALVLLSAPVFGTAWAGPWAPIIPVAVGLVFGGWSLLLGRILFLRRREELRRGLAAAGLDADRPAGDGLSAYYDVQLVLLRSEYEFLLTRTGQGAGQGTGWRARGSARLFEESFGFTPEDPFETGPLNVAPDTRAMRALRERWERRLATRREAGEGQPALGLSEDRAYRVFPREMTVPMELATRRAYLEISRHVLRGRYGRDPENVPVEVRERARRDLSEHAALTRKVGRDVSRRRGP